MGWIQGSSLSLIPDEKGRMGGIKMYERGRWVFLRKVMLLKYHHLQM